VIALHKALLFRPDSEMSVSKTARPVVSLEAETELYGFTQCHLQNLLPWILISSSFTYITGQPFVHALAELRRSVINAFALCCQDPELDSCRWFSKHVLGSCVCAVGYGRFLTHLSHNSLVTYTVTLYCMTYPLEEMSYMLRNRSTRLRAIM
jgi:hypothetical protein